MSKETKSFEIGDWRFELDDHKYPRLSRVYHNDKEIRVHDVVIEMRCIQPIRINIDGILIHTGDDDP